MLPKQREYHVLDKRIDSKKYHVLDKSIDSKKRDKRIE